MSLDCSFWCFLKTMLSLSAGLVLILYIWRKYFTSVVSLKGKHVLITGGSSGIGKSLACEAAKGGANVTILARNEERLKAAKEEISKHTSDSEQKIEAFSVDVSGNYGLLEKAIALAEEAAGPTFMLVNCAGSAICGVLEDLTDSEIKSQMSLNVVGSILPCKAVVEGMKKRRQGHIVLTSSQGGYLGIYGLSAYCASKFALRGFAEALDMEVGSYSVKVTIAYPPDTDTPGFEEEEKRKPAITREISQSSGLYQPDVVAKTMLQHSLEGRFTSNIGMDGFLLEHLCAGMTKVDTLLDFLFEVTFGGLLRIVAGFYQLYFRRIISKSLITKA